MPLVVFMSNFCKFSEKSDLLMKILLLYCLTGFLLFQSCGFYGRQRGPTDWHRIPKPDYTIPPQAQYIGGLKICLDPGHGGDNHIQNYKRGPTGLREAEINLRVALYLKEFLEKSGATVILTRDGDYEVDLKNELRWRISIRLIFLFLYITMPQPILKPIMLRPGITATPILRQPASI